MSIHGSILQPSPAASAMQSISSRFEEQVSDNRDRLAVAAADRNLTYGQLNEAANRLAREVLAAAPDTDTVAVLIGQGASIILAMLGVLKAGKIFVPLDTRQPLPRMLQILEDCEARVIVTDGQSLRSASELIRPGLQLVNIDALNPVLTSNDLRLSIAGEAPACLIYTSGSTGSPKGVVQSHRGLLHRTKALSDVLQLTDKDRFALLATCSVVQGVSSTLQALLHGASIHPFDLRGLGVGALAPWLVEHEITILVCTPSTFRHFAETLGTPQEFPDLRVIRLGAEQILPHHFALYRSHFRTGCVLIGTLGSTEAGPVANYVMDHDSDIADVVPAGYPLDGTIVRILDDDGRVCPAGESGEIVVQNSFLFPGYWRDPGRTAAAFVDVPGEACHKFYRTGDIGKMRPDGSLEYLGRKNLQVKVRGFRVEPEEIERALCAHQSVLEAAVIARSDSTGDSRLAAYIAPRGEQSVTTQDLCSHLRMRLPEHMVPSSFEFLASLPLTDSGKVDRAALRAARATPSAVSAADGSPTNAVQVRLTKLWEELLDHRPIGVTANFFDLGGDSLLAARLCASIEQSFGVRFPLAAFVQATTIEGQERLIRARSTTSPASSLVAIRASGSKPPLFCVHLTDGHVLSYRDLARHLPSDQPLYGLQSRGLDGRSPINLRIEDMARDYVAEIQKLRPDGPYAICGWSFGGKVAFEMARQLEQEGRAVALLALFDTPGIAHAHRSKSSPARLLSRLPIHVRTLLFGPDRLIYLGQKARIAKILVETPIWRLLLRWYGSGGWLPRILHNVYQANRNARRDYVLRAYGGRVTLFTAAEHSSQRRDSLLGWGILANGGVDVHDVRGNHFDMLFEPHVRTLTEKLAHCLDIAWSGVQVATDRPMATRDGGNRAA